MEEIEKKLSIIFDKISSDQRKELKDTSYLQLSEKVSINFPNTELLINLFSVIQQDEKLKESFINILKKKIDIDCEEYLNIHKGFHITGISPLCFLGLVKIGYIEDALEALEKRVYKNVGIYTVIDKILDQNYFNSDQIEKIYELLKDRCRKTIFIEIHGRYEITDILKKKLIELRYDFLKIEIKSTNVEINQDKKTVTEKIRSFGFSTKYQEFLDSIDSFLNTENSKPLNAGMISTLRSFLAELVTDLAHKIAEIEHEKIPVTKPSELGNMRSYLKIKLDLTDNDNKFIDSFIDILHYQGGHSFMSEKEYFRLARNIAIEIALFILSKFGKKYPKIEGA